MKRIFITNIHPQLRISLEKIESLVAKILKKNLVARFIEPKTSPMNWATTKTNQRKLNVNIILVDDKFMRRLNRKFAKRTGTTDVLSFEMGGDKNIFKKGSEKILGEVYVNLDQAKKNAQNYKSKFADEVALLVTHGVLHLLGYDHKKKSDFLVMREKENEYLSSSG